MGVKGIQRLAAPPKMLCDMCICCIISNPQVAPAFFSQEDVHVFKKIFRRSRNHAMSGTEDSTSVNFSLAQRLSLNKLCSHSKRKHGNI